jgi:hypothetical protein
MKCLNVEERLSEYLERTLPPEEMSAVAEHLHDCTACSSLFEEMRAVLADCKAFPSFVPDPDFIERILLRTSGRPRTRSWRELLQGYLRPMLTPRFAVGAVMALLFVIFSANLLKPRVASVASLLSPRLWVQEMDRGVQQIYSQGLKAYDAKNEWQARLTFFKNNVFNRLGFFMEQLDVPVEGKQKSQEPKQRDNKGPNDKSSSSWLSGAGLSIPS